MYQFDESIDWEGFFPFDKKWIEDMNLACIPDASKSVLPVILSFSNESGVSFPSHETIAALTGMSTRTVQEAVKGLDGFPGLEISKYQTKRGRMATKYKMTRFPPRDETGRAFFFHKSLIQAGNWRLLEKMVSSGLYLVMRYFGYFDAELYRLDECEKDDNGALLDMEIPELYKIRKYDLCEATVSVLARYAGISRPSVYEGLQDLKARHLVEGPWMDEDGTQRWKVYIRPPQYFKRGFLNDEIGKAHMRERERLDGKCKKASGRRVKKLPVGV